MAIYQDEKFVKRANKKLNYTVEQVDELRKCMDPDSGPLYFVENFLYVQHPVRGFIKFHPYEFQIELLDSYHRFNKSISLISRQMR